MFYLGPRCLWHGGGDSARGWIGTSVAFHELESCRTALEFCRTAAAELHWRKHGELLSVSHYRKCPKQLFATLGKTFGF